MEKLELAEIIGSNIGKYRNEAGLTQAALAEQVGITDSFLAQVEQGSKSMSTITLYRTAKALNVSFDALVTSSDCDGTQIQNIVTMLTDQPSQLQDYIEKVVLLTTERFGKSQDL